MESYHKYTANFIEKDTPYVPDTLSLVPGYTMNTRELFRYFSFRKMINGQTN